MEYLPPRLSLASLRKAAARCRGCDLYRYATQTVFGEGKARARFMLVGEEPGDKEDLAGHPFVGPAGRVLHDAMADAGIDPADAYVTNAVKHFKFIERGKRRIHQKPKVIEIQSCRPWLEAELEVVKPHLVVALGATASYSLMGPKFRLTQHRGELLSSPLVDRIVATVHPSSILRARDAGDRHREYALFVEDLRRAAQYERA
jgi:uracil-DNA glycosylase family protein